MQQIIIVMNLNQARGKVEINVFENISISHSGIKNSGCRSSSYFSNPNATGFSMFTLSLKPMEKRMGLREPRLHADSSDVIRSDQKMYETEQERRKDRPFSESFYRYNQPCCSS